MIRHYQYIYYLSIVFLQKEDSKFWSNLINKKIDHGKGVFYNNYYSEGNKQLFTNKKIESSLIKQSSPACTRSSYSC